MMVDFTILMPKPSHQPKAAMPLQNTLEKTEAVTAVIERASHQLSVVNTVLEQNLPPELQVGDVAQAINQTEQLEKKLSRSVEALTEVSAALEAELKKRTT